MTSARLSTPLLWRARLATASTTEASASLALLLAFSMRAHTLLARAPALRKTAKIKWSVRSLARSPAERWRAVRFHPPCAYYSRVEKSATALTDFWRSVLHSLIPRSQHRDKEAGRRANERRSFRGQSGLLRHLIGVSPFPGVDRH